MCVSLNIIFIQVEIPKMFSMFVEKIKNRNPWKSEFVTFHFGSSAAMKSNVFSFPQSLRQSPSLVFLLEVRGYLAGEIQCFGFVQVAVVYRDLCGSNPIVLRRLLYKAKKSKSISAGSLQFWPWPLGGVHWRLKVIEIHSASAGSMSIRFPTAHVDAYLIECQRGREIIDGCTVYFRFSLQETSERNTHICMYMRKRSIRVWFSSTSVMDMCLFEYKAYACLICLLFCSLR